MIYRLKYTTRTGRVTFDETGTPLELLVLLAARVKGWDIGAHEHGQSPSQWVSDDVDKHVLDKAQKEIYSKPLDAVADPHKPGKVSLK